jgi:hypothetical protein
VDNGFDVSSMAKLHNIFEQNAPWAKTIKMAMETGDISLLKKCLKDAPKEQGLKWIITTTDVDDIIKNLDIFNSKMVSWVDDVWLLLKGMVKIFTKLT